MRISDWSSDVCSSDLCLVHAIQAHLGQEVEVVLVQDNHVRRRVAQRRCVLVGAFRKHGVEQRHVVPHLSQHRGYLAGGARRIRLAAFPLLLVASSDIALADLSSVHVPAWFPAPLPCFPFFSPSSLPPFLSPPP